MAYDKEYYAAYRSTEEYKAKVREYKRRKREELINSPEYIEAKRQKAIIVAANYKAKKRRSSLKYFYKNREALNAKAREQWRLKHPPKPKKPAMTKEEKRLKQLANSIAYYHANKEKCKANIKKWQVNNRERMNELVRNWQEKNPEKYKEMRKRHAEKNKKIISERNKIYHARKFAENPDAVRKERQERKKRLLASNPEKYLEMRRRGVSRAGKKRVGQMKDSYINHLLTKGSGLKLKVEEVPTELMEAKRLQLMIKRELRK
jgi:hypothetical protein